MLFQTPILLIIFNRPNSTLKVFNEIKKIQPKKLYIAADGPRKTKVGEEEICDRTRKLVIENITWECEVRSLFRDKNLGCKAAVSTAVNWFFENEEHGIILEDDCLPELSFFNFCEVLLERFKNERSVMHVGGTNFLNEKIVIADSYYFSKMIHVWGWATWRRAWRLYDIEMKDLDRLDKKLDEITTSKKAKNYWTDIFKKVKKNKIDTWDYQWQYSIWINKGLGITPAVNMISNIGFGPDATHTNNLTDPMANMGTKPITTLKHPSVIKINFDADDFEIANLSLPLGNFNLQLRRAIIFLKKKLKL